jgi:hypothetical protein
MAPRPGTREWEGYWWLAQDLGPGPHHYIAVHRGSEEIGRFNNQRGPWHYQDDITLRKMIERLNELEAENAASIDAFSS